MGSPSLVGKEVRPRYAIPDAESVDRTLAPVHVSLACIRDESLVVGMLHIPRRRAMLGAIAAGRVELSSRELDSVASQLPCDEILTMAKARSSRWLLQISGM